MLIDRITCGAPEYPSARRSASTVATRSLRCSIDGHGVGRVGAEVLAPDLVDLRLGDQRAESRGQTGVDRNDDLRHPHLGGDVAGVQRSRATERDQRELPRIEAAVDREHPDRVGHVLVGDVDHGLRRGMLVEPEPLAQRVERLVGLGQR